MAAGATHTCVTFRDKVSMMCFGENDKGQTHVPWPYLTEYRSELLATGGQHNCATGQNQDIETGAGVNYFTTDYKFMCWGYNNFGQAHPPYGIDAEQMLKISLGLFHSCVLFKSGHIVCFGSDSSDQFIKPTQSRMQPLYYSVDCGLDHTCTIKYGSGELNCVGIDVGGSISQMPSTFKNGTLAVALGFD